MLIVVEKESYKVLYKFKLADFKVWQGGHPGSSVEKWNIWFRQAAWFYRSATSASDQVRGRVERQACESYFGVQRGQKRLQCRKDSHQRARRKTDANKKNVS